MDGVKVETSLPAQAQPRGKMEWNPQILMAALTGNCAPDDRVTHRHRGRQFGYLRGQNSEANCIDHVAAYLRRTCKGIACHREVGLAGGGRGKYDLVVSDESTRVTDRQWKALVELKGLLIFNFPTGRRTALADNCESDSFLDQLEETYANIGSVTKNSTRTYPRHGGRIALHNKVIQDMLEMRKEWDRLGDAVESGAAECGIVSYSVSPCRSLEEWIPLAGPSRPAQESISEYRQFFGTYLKIAHAFVTRRRQVAGLHFIGRSSLPVFPDNALENRLELNPGLSRIPAAEMAFVDGIEVPVRNLYANQEPSVAATL